jgi:hypothetical protein
MPAHGNHHPLTVPAAVGAAIAVAFGGLAATVVTNNATERLLLIAATVGVLAALLPDTQAWLAVTAVGIVTVLVTVDDGGPSLIALALATVVGRGQRWIRRSAAEAGQSATVDR